VSRRSIETDIAGAQWDLPTPSVYMWNLSQQLRSHQRWSRLPTRA